MSNHHHSAPAARGAFWFVRRLFVAACVVIALFAVIGYAGGWVKIDHDSARQTTTIEVETGEVEEAAEEAAAKSKTLIKKAGSELKDLGD